MTSDLPLLRTLSVAVLADSCCEKDMGPKVNTKCFCTRVFENPSGHGRLVFFFSGFLKRALAQTCLMAWYQEIHF